jgi:D-alanyl-D-alanine dipeptidase
MSILLRTQAIPKLNVPNITDYKIEPVDEKIVSLREAGFHVESQYYKDGVPGAYPDCYVREGLIPLLKEAQSYLPEDICFKIYDGYRPICIQQRLWNIHRAKIKYENPNLSDDEIDFKTSFFVSKPSYDINKPSLHNTGGAIDLTLMTKSGYELNMGTLFDDFTDRAWSNHFEEYASNRDVQENRRMLYNAMTKAGFTNLPSEWWHYDYGDKFWSYFTGNPAKYIGVLDIDFPNRFPLE